jgi:ribosomal-protein-alanine N-acetyltransferase
VLPVGSHHVPAAVARVILKPVLAEDIDETALMLAESAEFHRGWVSYPTAVDSVASFVMDAAANGMTILGVRCMADNAFAGIMTLCRFSGEPWATAEYGCAVGVRHRGYGYMTEATQLLVPYAFQELSLHRLEALVQPGNYSSARMLTASGFRPEGLARGAIRVNGVWTDHTRWAITAEDCAGH